MLQPKDKLTLFFLCWFTLLNYSFTCCQQLSLKVEGDKQAGFHVDIYHGNRLVIDNSEEFSLQLFNLDLSTVATIQQWKGQEWTGNEKSIMLKRVSYLKDFDANLSVTVTYLVVDSDIVKKTVELFQPSMPGMIYIMQQTTRPAEEPQRYVTFEYDSFPGGFVHEMFPSAGFVTPDNNVIGL